MAEILAAAVLFVALVVAIAILWRNKMNPDLNAKITALTAAVQSATAEISTLKAKEQQDAQTIATLQANAVDPAELQAVSDGLDSNIAALNQAVAAAQG